MRFSVPLFKRFSEIWNTLPKEHYDGLDLNSDVNRLAENTLESLNAIITGEKQVRDDYKELIGLTMIVLNKPPAKIDWRSPGRIHHARWMAKLLYAMKIFLFRNNLQGFKLNKREEIQIFRFVRFGALIYTKIWFEAPLATDAPMTCYFGKISNYI